MAKRVRHVVALDLNPPTQVKTVSCARVGILGNPSDGYAGKTIATTIENFRAEVALKPSQGVRFVPNPAADRNAFSNLSDLIESVSSDGYDGGIKLLMATAKVFVEALEEESIALPSELWRGFEVSYSTNVPRQMGLAGSSAICTAAFRALLEWHCVPDEYFPPERLANYVLRVEQRELGIAAGLQDRVAQAFDRPVYMDFTPEAFAHHKGIHGEYETLPSEVSKWLQGKLFLLIPSAEAVTAKGGKSSGKVHSPVRKRWEEGDLFVREKMKEIAALAEKGKAALIAQDSNALINLMNQNFDIRCEIFGDAVAERDRALIHASRSFGKDVGAKLPGSGGAVLVFTPRGHEFLKAMAARPEVEAIALKVKAPAD